MKKSAILNEYINEHASIIMMLLDERGFVKKSNIFADRILGAAIVGKNIRNLILDFTGELSLDKLLESSDPLLLNVKTPENLPETFYFSFYKTDDELTLVLGEQSEKENVKLRQELLALNNELNNLSRELYKKNTELHQMNEQKNEFLGVAAHDLRNPIGLVMSYSDYLQDELRDRLNDEEMDILKTLESQSQFMLDLLNELLDFARIESGKVKLDMEVFDLLQLVSKSIRLNKPFGDKKDIRINLKTALNSLSVNADMGKIEQVMNNLLSNAIKFSEAGTNIEVELMEKGKYARVSVKDQGPGIPEKELPLLFKTFSKTSVRPTADEKSTGLGLAIVKKIVDVHGGSIRVESKAGAGSEFIFLLPALGGK